MTNFSHKPTIVLTIFVIALMHLFAYAQNNVFTLKGSVKNYDGRSYMFLTTYPQSGNSTVDSVALRNGTFQFSGRMDTVCMADLALKKNGSITEHIYIYLEPGVITVNEADSLANAIVDGTTTNHDNLHYKLERKVADDEWDTIEAHRKSLSLTVQRSPDFLAGYNEQIDNNNKHYNTIDKDFIRNNPRSYLSVVLLWNVLYLSDYDDIAPLIEGLSPQLKQTKDVKRLLAYLPNLRNVSTGVVAPDFSAADTSGKIISLSSLRGNYLLVDFWASWCIPCREQNPLLEKVYSQFKNKNFTVIGCSLDNNRQTWLKAIKHDSLTYIQVSDLKGWKSEMAEQYALCQIPKNFLIDPDGKIVGHNLSASELERKLTEIFGKH